MVIMALDHVRDFLMELRFDPADLSQTNVALSFTRWITHIALPVTSTEDCTCLTAFQ
jgi:uncharacterized membrane protein